MDCLQAREAMSAQMDGEPPEVADALVAVHVQRCEACQAWREAAFEVTRRVRMTGWTAPEQPEALTEVILAAVRPRRLAGWLPRLRVALLVAAAIGQLVLTVPLLSDAAGGGMQMDMHETHELGVFDFALAVAFLIGAIRPRLAAGLAWPCGAAALGLLATSTVDVITHHTFEGHELRHLIAVAGAVLLCWAAREERRPEPGGVRLEAVAAGGRPLEPAANWYSTGQGTAVGDAYEGSGPPAAAAGGGAA
jgi:predicted anti-sigma-YlaC factor YlaD